METKEKISSAELKLLKEKPVTEHQKSPYSKKMGFLIWGILFLVTGIFCSLELSDNPVLQTVISVFVILGSVVLFYLYFKLNKKHFNS